MVRGIIRWLAPSIIDAEHGLEDAQARDQQVSETVGRIDRVTRQKAIERALDDQARQEGRF